jgi:hypothetical protein
VVPAEFDARASITLFASSDAGLSSPLPAPSKSLLLIFGDTQIGAVIEPLGLDVLSPGAQEVPVVLRFWAAAVACELAVPGADFRLWYAGRDVGSGRVEQALQPDAPKLAHNGEG